MDFKANIVALLRERQQIKTRADEIRGELLRIVVSLGVEQEEVGRMDVAAFLDGYLVAHGHVQEWRKL